jgi:hypothetical protein
LPVVWVVGDAALIGGDAAAASNHRLGLSLVPVAATEAAVIGVKARLPVVGVVSNAGLVVVDARAAGGEGLGLLVFPAASTEARVVGVEAGLPVIGVVGHARLIGVNARAACGHSLGSSSVVHGLGLSLVPVAAAEARVVGVKAGLPVIRVVGHAGLVVGDARAAGGHVDGSVAPRAAAEAGVVGVEASLPVVWVVGNAGLVVGDARAAGGEGGDGAESVAVVDAVLVLGGVGTGVVGVRVDGLDVGVDASLGAGGVVGSDGASEGEHSKSNELHIFFG